MADDSDKAEQAAVDRRSFLTAAGSIAMAGGLAASYGTLAFMAGRFLYPADTPNKAWMFVSEVARMQPGEALVFRTPAGASAAIARQGSGGTADDFIALSSTCPHLGCQVHWEANNNRFFCPCHNGVFDPTGKATAGPPAEAGQSLPRYPLKVENGLLFIEVPVVQLATAESCAPIDEKRPGHDPCLGPQPGRWSV